ncbi:MAG TPA: M28 family peptidase [Candidatus Deferrimicrobium sp.]|nr:M28 family peptidase [Candidatus Deferrimicrobium sp.]
MDNYHEELAYQQTQHLCQWQRFIGSEGESKAKHYIYEQFKDLGIDCESEPFTCSDFLTKILLRIGLCLMAGLLLLSSYFFWVGSFLLSVIFAGTLIVVLLGANVLWTGSDLGARLGTQFNSENLVGHLKARNPIPKRAVVIMSHYDTKSQSFPLIFRITLFVIGAAGSLALILLVFIFGLVQLFTTVNYLNGFVVLISSIIVAACNILLLLNFTGNKSVGATDNAAAVGVQIAMSRALLDFPPENTDVFFLATSAEEIGLLGSIAFIKNHEKDFNKDSTYFLNYDVIGGEGQIILHTRYGIPPKKTCDEINDLLLDIAKEKNLKVGTQYLPVGASADHLPILKRGFKTTWIQTGDRKVTTKIHTSKDNMDLITKESLRTAIILGFEFIQRIDKKP